MCRSDKQQSPSLPPKLGERLLTMILREEDVDMVLGDFTEAYRHLVVKNGFQRAKWWYWIEIFKALPALGWLSGGKYLREVLMKSANAFQHNNHMAFVGLLLITPALLLCSGGILQSGFGITSANEVLDHSLFLFHPVVILSGLFIAFGINLLPVVAVKYQEGSLIGKLQIQGRSLNLIMLVSILMMCSIIFLYLLAENFQIFAHL